MAESDTTGSPENAAGTTDEIEATAGLETLLVEQVSLHVDDVPGDGHVTLCIRDDKLNGRFFLEADEADRLAGELHDHAEAVRADE